jgi:hypothetical protein
MSNNNPGCLGLILQAMGVLPKQKEFLTDSLPYALRDDFLSSAELSFYKVLEQTIGERAIVCPKVSLKDIFFVRARDRSKFYTYNNKINLKHVDFLICSKETLKPICGIELDDLSHARQDRIERDEFVDRVFKAADLKLIRIPNKTSYSIVEIEEKIKPLFMKDMPEKIDDNEKIDEKGDAMEILICKKCGIPMVLRVAKRGENTGQEFYGCVNYPKCKEIIEID